MRYYGLVDCNNFFASCERVFRPDLKDKPVAVLSNNDGVVVARTQEVKDLGVPMAVAAFKWREVLEKNKVTLLSANFALYSDLSKRITHILEEESPEIEVYSIDESFLKIEAPQELIESWAVKLRARILKEIGVPVSIGLGATKTLAKAASEYAKKHVETGGVCILSSNISGQSQKTLCDINQVLKNMRTVLKEKNEVLEWLPVGDVWGIGRQLTKKLNAQGVYTANGLAGVSASWARKQLSLSGEKTVRELNGESCINLNEREGQEQKSILVSRSFAEEIRHLSELEVAVASFATTLAHKLRKQNLLTTSINVFASSSRFKENRVSIGGSFHFDIPTADSAVITKGALEKLAETFIPGPRYKRAGVYSGELKGLNARQLNLFVSKAEIEVEKEIRRGEAIDEIADKYGSSAIKVAAAVKRSDKSELAWRSRAERRSPEYTTNWAEIATVVAKQY